MAACIGETRPVAENAIRTHERKPQMKKTVSVLMTACLGVFALAGLSACGDNTDVGNGNDSTVTTPQKANSLAGRYFWGSKYTYTGVAQKTLFFANDGLVYTSAMEGKWATCQAADKDCLPYRYTTGSNQLTIDGMSAQLNGRTLTYDSQTYYEFGAPAPGTRWDGVLTYSNSSGCPMYCTYTTENLHFKSDGRFISDGVVSGGDNMTFDFINVPADKKGTYEVRSDKMMLLKFANGAQRLETVAVYLDDAGKPKSPAEGLILDGDGYFDISNN